jgi:hypothetical protein
MAIPEKEIRMMERQSLAEVSQRGLLDRVVNVTIAYLIVKAVYRYWGMSMNRLYPDWADKIPVCPLLANQAEERFNDCRGVAWAQSNSLLGIYHPGAAFSVRSAEPTYITYQTLLGPIRYGHGQQCTFNTDGELITSGRGAGTPDFFSPATSSGFILHLIYDVLPWWFLGDEEYKRYWIPNGGGSCLEAPRSAPPVFTSAAAHSGRIAISLDRGGAIVSGHPALHVGDRFKVHVQVDGECRFTLVHRASDGRATELAPAAGDSEMLSGGRAYAFPSARGSSFRVTDPAGDEEFILRCEGNTISRLRWRSVD